MENILDVYQLHIGLEDNILAKPEECKHSNSCWIKELITAMARFHIKIYRQNGIKLTLQRQNDITIMQLVKSQCNDTECRHINTCRQYLCDFRFRYNSTMWKKNRCKLLSTNTNP